MIFALQGDKRLPIYVDESGYTGANLLDPSQEWFCLATLRGSEEWASSKKSEHFGSVKAQELKFGQLKKRYLRNCESFLRSLAEDESVQPVVKCYLFDKPYALLLKLVEHVIEPMLYEQGVNLYRNGGHVALANLFWYHLMAKGGKSLLREFLEPFQNTITSGDWALMSTTREMAEALSRDCEPFALISETIAFHQSRPTAFPDGILDLALPGLLRLLQAWRASTSESGLCVIHDQTRNMEAKEEFWTFLTAIERAEFSANSRDGGEVAFPIGVESTNFVSSHLHPGVQLADVMAGLILHHIDGRLNHTQIPCIIEELAYRGCMMHLLPSQDVAPLSLGLHKTDQNETLEYLTAELLRSSKK